MSTELLLSLRVGEASRGQRSLGNCPRLSSTLEAESGFPKGSPLLSQEGWTGIALHPCCVPSTSECPLLVQGPQRASVNAPASCATGPESGRAGPLRGTRDCCVRSACWHNTAPTYSTDVLPNSKYSGAWQRQTHRASDRLDTQPASLSRAEVRLHSGAFTAFMKRSENSVYLIDN